MNSAACVERACRCDCNRAEGYEEPDTSHVIEGPQKPLRQ